MDPARRSMRWLWVAVGIALIAACLYWWNTDNQRDRRVWNRFRESLTEAGVARVEVGGTGGGKAAVAAQEKASFLAELRAAKFERSNRVGHGPTPVGIIYLTFADGSQESIGIWGATTFELSPERLDPHSQFLIRSDTLGIWLQNHLQGPAIGEAPAGLSAAGALFMP
jgi:hypothetical protein